MEDATGSDEVDTAFYCNICKVSCASAMNLQSHFLGFTHRQAEWQLRNHGDKQFPVKPAATLEEQLNACLVNEPALGLEYIYEFQKDGNSKYACKLCSTKLSLGHMFLHITGAKHRVNYLNKHHPALGTDKPYAMKGPKKLKKLKETCMEVEEKFGRKKINVVQGSIPLNFGLKVDHPPSLNYGPDSNLQNIDFTNEDFSVTDGKAKKCKPKPPEQMTFLELKAAHEADLLKAAACVSLSENTVETPESDHDNEEITGDGGKEGNNGNDKEVCSLELANRDPAEFTNNKEIIDFLGSYKIFEENDISFLLKAIEKLGNALVQYKKRCEEMEEKRVSSSDFSDEEMNMDELPSLKHTHADQEISTHSTDEMHADSVITDDQSPTHASVEILPETIINCQIQVPDSTTQSTSFSTHSTDEMHPDSITTDDQSQKFPAFKVNDKTPTNASSPGRLQESETSSKQEEIFSSVAESSFRPDSTQDSATKGNESTNYPAIKVDDKAPTGATTSDRPQDAEGQQNYIEPLLPVSQFDPITESNPLAPTAAQFSIPLDSATKDNESTEYPAFKVGNKAPTRASTSDRPQDAKGQQNYIEPLLPVSQFDPITESNPLVPTSAQFSIPLDSATKDNESAEYPAFKVGNKAPTRAPTSDRPQDSATERNQRAEYPAFKVDDKAPTRATTSYRPQDAKGQRDNIRPLFSVSQFEPVNEANPLVPRAAQFSIPPDFATKGNQRVEYPAFKLGNKEPTRAPTSDRPQYSATNRNQRPEYPAFNNDKAPTRAPISDRPQDSATRRNQRTEYPAFKVDNKAPTRAPTSDRPQESLNSYNQNQKFPGSSWYGDKGYNSGSHTSSLPASTKPRESPNIYNQNQKFSGSSSFGNKEHNFGSHTSSLPASTKPLESKPQSFSSLTLNRGAPTTQPRYPIPGGNSQHMSQNQQFNSMAEPKRTGSAPPRAPFPHELLNKTAPRAAQPAPPRAARPAPPRAGRPAPPRAAQPAASRAAQRGLPVAQDEITAQFFESIKNMEVTEVVSTLNKITTTNPAFKGVHVPSLVQHLSETGKLKSSNSTPFKQ